MSKVQILSKTFCHFGKAPRHIVSTIVLVKSQNRFCSSVCYSSQNKLFSYLQPKQSSNKCKINNVLQSHVKLLHTSNLVNSQSISNILVDNNSQHVDVTIGGDVLKLPFVWLRDHCRSETYYNSATNQKNADPDLMKKDLTPKDVLLAESENSLNITWKDGHESNFSGDWLKENFYPGQFSRTVEQLLWQSETLQSQLPRVGYAEHMGTDEGLKKTLTNLIKYGFSLVDETPASMEGTEEVCRRVTFVLQTLFGGMWSFTADASRSDTAYSTLALGAHTDMTYMDLPAGIQVFHCLKHTGSGGETLLVDGFRACEELRQTHPDSFDLLSQLVIPHEYKEPVGDHSSGYHLYSLGTVIRLHPASGEIMQLRFNPYDRAPLNTVAPQQQEKFYDAYDKLSRIIAKKEGELWVKLKPGSVVLINNWRVMHGRSGFDGERVMCGCYLPRDEWVSRARTFGLL